MSLTLFLNYFFFSFFSNPSVAIEGTCLTVTRIMDANQLEFGLSPETLRRTNLSDRVPGDKARHQKQEPKKKKTKQKTKQKQNI